MKKQLLVLMLKSAQKEIHKIKLSAHKKTSEIINHL